jgi:hypothetical protein
MGAGEGADAVIGAGEEGLSSAAFLEPSRSVADGEPNTTPALSALAPVSFALAGTRAMVGRQIAFTVVFACG